MEPGKDVALPVRVGWQLYLQSKRRIDSIIIISLFCIAPNPYVVQSASQLKLMNTKCKTCNQYSG